MVFVVMVSVPSDFGKVSTSDPNPETKPYLP
jgi:hypothetical protein